MGGASGGHMTRIRTLIRPDVTICGIKLESGFIIIIIIVSLISLQTAENVVY